MKNLMAIICVSAALFAPLSCRILSGVADKGGGLLDGSAFAEKNIEKFTSEDKRIVFRLFTARDGTRHSALVLRDVPHIQFYGTPPDEAGAFSITRVRFLSSNPDGWLEGDMTAEGSGSFVRVGDGKAAFFIDGGISLGALTAGAIRFSDRRLHGESALSELEARKERLLYLIAWMRERNAPFFETQKDFEAYWRPILLPETVKPKLRPARYTELSAEPAAVFAEAEGYKWNTAYTRGLLPENLRPLRDSGTLLRDWEEASAWLYAGCQWETTVERRLRERRYLSR